MTSPTGTPDWTKPLPSGSVPVIVDPGGSVFSPHFTPVVDVTAYNALDVQINITGTGADFFFIQLFFYTDAAGTNFSSVYTAVMNGGQRLDINWPTLGPYCQIEVQKIGGGSFTITSIRVIGHNAGVLPRVSTITGPLAGGFPTVAPVGLATVINVPVVITGPAVFGAYTDAISVRAYVQSTDAGGVSHFVGGMILPGPGIDTRQLLLPAQPLQVVLFPPGGGNANVYWGLTVA